MSISIIEKLKIFADLGDGLREPTDENEIHNLLKDIGVHGTNVYQYMKLIEEDAKRLKSEYDRIYTAYKQQEKKAKSIKNYLKEAMKASGFDKLKAGGLMMSLSTVTKMVPKRKPNEFDYINYPELVRPEFSWARAPDVSDLEYYHDIIYTNFEWDIDKLKNKSQEGNKIALEVLEKVDNYRFSVKVHKES